jgi:hypothetical protein
VPGISGIKAGPKVSPGIAPWQAAQRCSKTSLPRRSSAVPAPDAVPAGSGDQADSGVAAGSAKATRTTAGPSVAVSTTAAASPSLAAGSGECR